MRRLLALDALGFSGCALGFEVRFGHRAGMLGRHDDAVHARHTSKTAKLESNLSALTHCRFSIVHV